MTDNIFTGPLNRFNKAAQPLAITRDTLATVDRVVQADIANLIKNLNNDFKDLRSVSILFSNITGQQHQPTGPFTIVAIFGPNSGIVRYTAIERQQTPWATFRILELFEGAFSSFVEYPPFENEQEEAA